MGMILSYHLPYQLEIFNQFGYWAYREAVSRVDAVFALNDWVCVYLAPGATPGLWGC